MSKRIIAAATCLAVAWAASLGAQEPASPPDSPTVLITGANRGIGFEFVRQLSARDWQVIATARNPGAANELQELSKTNPNIAIEELDVTDDAEIAALAEKYRGRPIDILLLNAAKGPSAGTAMHQLEQLDWQLGDELMQVNAFGPMKVAAAFMPNVKASYTKQIIVMSSDSGSFVAGSQAPILFHYKASKAALNMYFHTLAFATRKPGVTVVMLHPGLVGTNEQLAKFPGAIKTQDSVSQMLLVIDGLSKADNGRFISYTGDTMPW